MMRGIEVAAWGVVGKIPELKTSKSGTPYCSVSVGVTTGQDDAGKDITQWCRVTVFKELAEQVAGSITKGNRVYFEGSLSLNRWRTSDGQGRTDINVTAWKLEKVGAIGKNRPTRQVQNYQAPLERREQQPEFDDAMPF
jgi:single stranded DNA-binding protein